MHLRPIVSGPPLCSGGNTGIASQMNSLVSAGVHFLAWEGRCVQKQYEEKLQLPINLPVLPLVAEACADASGRS